MADKLSYVGVVFQWFRLDLIFGLNKITNFFAWSNFPVLWVERSNIVQCFFFWDLELLEQDNREKQEKGLQKVRKIEKLSIEQRKYQL